MSYDRDLKEKILTLEELLNRKIMDMTVRDLMNIFGRIENLQKITNIHVIKYPLTIED